MKSVFVLVEGRDTDSFFYSQLLRPVCDAAGVAYDIVRANILAGGGGKGILVELHGYLEANASLSQVVENRKKWCVFYLDKDVDDVMGKLIVSSHIVYTPFYCVENGLFMHGRLIEAAAAASSIDPAEISVRIPDPDNWRREKAEHWKEFLVLSLLSRKLSVNCKCHYGCMTSPLNAPAEAPTNVHRAAVITTELRNRSRLPVKRFDLKHRAVRRYVDRQYRKGRHDSLFNGKWYLEFLRREINGVAGGKRHNNPPNSALISTLNLSIDFGANWAEHFRQPIRDLIR